MSDPQRLHPAAILEYLVRNIRALLEMLIPVLVVLFSSPLQRKWTILLLLLFFALYISYAILYWLRYRYGVDDEEFRVEYGVFVNKNIYIPLERIQSVQTSAGVIQRLFGLVKLEVQTAGGGKEAEVSLPAITWQQSQELQQMLEASSPQRLLDDQTDPQYQEKRIPFRQLMVAASTSNGLGVVVVGAMALISQIEQMLPDLNIYEWLGMHVSGYLHQGPMVWVIGIALILLSAWVLSILGTLLRLGGFVLRREENKLLVSRGWLEKRHVSIPLKRIQAVKIVEGVLRQPLGLATVYVVSAGHGDEAGQDTIVFPIMPVGEVEAFLDQFLPEFRLEKELHPLQPAARNRYYSIFTIPVLLVCIPISVFYPYGFFTLLLPAAAWLLGRMQFRDGGWLIRDDQIVIRFRMVGRLSYLIPRRRIQSLELRQTILQKRKGLLSFKLQLASSLGGTEVGLNGLNWQEGNTILEWLYKKQDIHPTISCASLSSSRMSGGSQEPEKND